MATLSKKVNAEFEMKNGEDFKTYDSRATKLMNEMQAVSDALPEDEITGGIISFPYADGHALYLVEKAKPLTLQHIPYMDAWQVDAALIRGLRVVDVQQKLKGRKNLKAMFAK